MSTFVISKQRLQYKENKWIIVTVKNYRRARLKINIQTVCNAVIISVHCDKSVVLNPL
jgi:hypothetical protein